MVDDQSRARRSTSGDRDRRRSAHGPLLPLGVTCFALLLVVAVTSIAWADEAGDQAMAEAQWQRAIDYYRAEIAASDSGGPIPTADLYFNLGLASAQLGHFGEANVALLHALVLSPNDSEIERTQEVVEQWLWQEMASSSQNEGFTMAHPEGWGWLHFFHRFKRLHVELAIILASWLTFGLLLLRRRMRPSAWRDTFAVVAVLTGLFLAAVVGYRVASWYTASTVQIAVVTSDGVMMREAPDRQAARRRESDLYLGASVRVHQTRENWVEVTLAGGARGWLNDELVELLEVRE